MKDNIDLIILLAGTVFVLAQLAFAWWKKKNPPKMVLAHDCTAYEKIDDIHDALAQKDQIAEGVQMVKTLGDISATQKSMVDVLKTVAKTCEQSSALTNELVIMFRSKR